MKSPVHLNALRAFEASARHQSFSAAAAELNVTPAAVGQLVRTLEDALGAPLFERSSSGKVRLVPTEAAERALPDIRAGFSRLTLGMERLREGSTSGVLTVTVSPAFAAKWLLPRIDRFQAACPDTDVRLDTNHKSVDFVAQRIDIGVRYGLGNWPGLQADKLMDEEVFPVCSPDLLRQRGKLRKPGDLARQTLIHDLSMVGHAGFPTWEAWMEKAGVADAAMIWRGLQINNSAAVLQAAIEGHGIALARSVMARDDLASGRLVRLFPDVSFALEVAYYVVYRPECASLPRLVAFRNWLLDEAASQNEPSAI
ncbi:MULTISPECIES: transcriptional regulator GcvA [Pseudomonadota]|jgi:LysR family glycine cleavage system transcriptional activator|uniref:Transcriptional regulator, LysR family n=3 Tax=Lysobacterales TaxID=135614 RepID=Q3BT28_XANE5|nr:MULTISPECIES: transcriptional regulator GcvA [Pseudomonadota]ABM41600.1 transcriptional regulator, LysR family [Acidovorax sp. JS42]AOY65888.1 LysR family transcriptional regulator [Xanthomonas euvesicatoria pv. vesicatoria str. 85-10]AQQ19653.1 LysR family transcriptional regulator [Burkholderia cenocepacia]KLB39143.1 LysR family transcriptional regulator [Xanthomonas euvesicatoria]MCC8581102.1 transcriptional regulator GcvA [Xanthomonas euvesicatoria pv. euvesicatoria]